MHAPKRATSNYHLTLPHHPGYRHRCPPQVPRPRYIPRYSADTPYITASANYLLLIQLELEGDLILFLSRGEARDVSTSTYAIYILDAREKVKLKVYHFVYEE